MVGDLRELLRVAQGQAVEPTAAWHATDRTPGAIPGASGTGRAAPGGIPAGARAISAGPRAAVGGGGQHARDGRDDLRHRDDFDRALSGAGLGADRDAADRGPARAGGPGPRRRRPRRSRPRSCPSGRVTRRPRTLAGQVFFSAGAAPLLPTVTLSSILAVTFDASKTRSYQRGGQ
jgi:hypothetical protein